MLINTTEAHASDLTEPEDIATTHGILTEGKTQIELKRLIKEDNCSGV